MNLDQSRLNEGRGYLALIEKQLLTTSAFSEQVAGVKVVSLPFPS
jgi:hypothetical protein